MKNKIIISGILVSLLLVSPFVAVLTEHSTTLQQERRKIAPVPQFPTAIRIATLRNFIKQTCAYYTDRIPFRAIFVRISQKIFELSGEDLDSKKCYRGRQNWLFLGNDYAHCVDTLCGRWQASPQVVRLQTQFFKEIQKIVNQRGASFAMMVGANKSSVYPEYLSPLVVPAAQRAITPLLQALTAAGVCVYDTTPHLRKQKNTALLYYRTDTHWNTLGAYEALKNFAITTNAIPAVPAVDFQPAGETRGDLVDIGGYETFPLTRGDAFTPIWENPQQKPFIDKKVLVLGDSFSGALMFYLQGMFTDVQRIHYGKIAIGNADIKKLSEFIDNMKRKPDIVLWIQVEREFILWGQQ